MFCGRDYLLPLNLILVRENVKSDLVYGYSEGEVTVRSGGEP